MALAHKTAFQLVNEAWRQRDSVETARLMNASARMMSVYQQGTLALQRMRTGGNQLVTVQHVNVNGGQAVVANNMKAGRGGKRIPHLEKASSTGCMSIRVKIEPHQLHGRPLAARNDFESEPAGEV